MFPSRRLLDIDILDHLVIGAGEYVSLRAQRRFRCAE
jgi:DNA repair protein RadC